MVELTPSVFKLVCMLVTLLFVVSNAVLSALAAIALVLAVTFLFVVSKSL